MMEIDETLQTLTYKEYSATSRSELIQIGLRHPEIYKLLCTQECLPLPEDLKELKMLESLYISANLEVLGEKLGSLGLLRWLGQLSLYDCHLRDVPREIAKLTELYSLNLSKNQLQSIPSFLKRLPELRGLYLRENDIQALPEWVFELRGLESLEVSKNPISKISHLLPGMISLRSLYISKDYLERGEAKKIQTFFRKKKGVQLMFS